MDYTYCKSGDFTLPHAPSQYPPDMQLEPTHMELKLNVNIEQKTVEGTNTITLQANVDGARKIKLHAVDFEFVNVTTEHVDWDYDGSFIEITLGQQLQQGQSTKVAIAYNVKDPVGGLYFSYPDETYTDRPVFVGSDHETERARYWIPCIDHPSVRTTFDFILTSQQDYTILAIGKEMSSSIENGMKTVHWHHDYPCPVYIAAIAVGKFVEYKDKDTDAGQGPIPVAYYTSDDYTAENLRLSFDRTPAMIEWFTKKFSMAMAWPKYYQYVLRGMGGAMENQSLVSWDDFAMLDEGSHKELAMLVDNVNIHEMAHTFFGDMVVIRDWGHAWLKESWATYVTALWQEDNVSYNDFLYRMYLNSYGYFNEADSKYIRPIVTRTFHHSWEMFDGHLYPGGAWRLHMLRHMLGDDVFFAAVSDYLNSYAGKTVETVDFVRKLEDHSKLSLAEFMDQWVLEPKGYPKLKLKFSYDKEEQEGTFTVIQTQVDPKKDEIKSRPFKLEIDLAWFDGMSYQVRSVSLDQKKHQFTYEMRKDPDHVRMDPDYKVLFKSELDLKDKYLKNQLKSPDIIGRIEAIKHLVKTGKRQNIEAVGEQYSKENFWGVKREIASALVTANSRFAVPHFVKILREEQDPMVIQYLMSDGANLRDQQVKEALKTRIEQGLFPYAKQNALRSLGAHRGDDVETTLKTHLSDTGWKYSGRVGAYRGLARTRNLEYVNLLIDKSTYGNEAEDVRQYLPSLLGSLGKWAEGKTKREIVEQLEDLLRDGNKDIRRSTVGALRALGSTSSVSKIQKTKGMHPAQTQLGFDKTVKAIRKANKPENKYKELVDRLEKIEDRLDKLDEKLQKMVNDGKNNDNE